jgi:hypothetical protein
MFSIHRPNLFVLFFAIGLALILASVSIVALHLGNKINLGNGILAHMIEAGVVRPKEHFLWTIQPDVYAGQQDTSERISLSCPVQNARTAVFLSLGQSNATNIGSSRHKGRSGVVNFNFFDGQCYEARDPLLGTTGDGGTIWTVLANRLISNGIFDNIILVPIAIGGASINRWSDPRDLGSRIAFVGEALKNAGLKVTQVFFLQGEADHHPEGAWARLRPSEFVRLSLESNRYSMRGEAYENHFFKVRNLLLEAGIYASISVAVKTRCGDTGLNIEGPVSRAQRNIIQNSDYVKMGPDINLLKNDVYSSDLCHLSDSGMEMIAEIWARTLYDTE